MTTNTCYKARQTATRDDDMFLFDFIKNVVRFSGMIEAVSGQ